MVITIQKSVIMRNAIGCHYVSMESETYEDITSAERYPKLIGKL